MFGLSPLGYVILVVASAWLIDFFLDNFVSTRLMGTALKLHPAMILITALAGANLLGLAGVVLAAPVAATAKLFLEYVLNKLLDRNPWDYIHSASPAEVRPLRTIFGPLFDRAVTGWRKLIALFNKR
jgi:predicted PurR-regulated permease PerM